MTEHNCQTIRDLLVDYADGGLSPADASRVGGHLDDCPECRAELQLLERSLELARAVWNETAVQSDDGMAVELPPQSRVPRLARPTVLSALLGKPAVAPWRWALAAAVLFVLAALPWLVPHGEPAKGPATGVAANVGVMNPEQIERYLAREESAARLSAAAALLGTQPGLEEQRRRAERYIIETYGDTAAGRKVSAGATPQTTKEPQS